MSHQQLAKIRARLINRGSLNEKCFPSYLREPLCPKTGFIRHLLFYLLQLPVQAFIWIALRPRAERPGNLTPDEVDRVYDRQAAKYDSTHHFTTRAQDTVWRRKAGWLIAAAPEEVPHVLDICTGTGLTIVESLRVLETQGKKASFVGIDYNKEMLRVADARKGLSGNVVQFLRADATKLVEGNQIPPGFATFPRRNFDIVTQVFGIGGIDNPIAVFRDVITLLRTGGRYLLIDMHQPIRPLPGEWPAPGKWIKTPEFEVFTYLYTTIPLALGRLWGWRDTTIDFYLAPLVCTEEDGDYYGFRIVSREVESERWWFSLPVMPTCRLVLEKIRITPDEYRARMMILSDLCA